MTQETDKHAPEQAPEFFDTVTYTGVGWTIPAPAQNPQRREWVGLTDDEIAKIASTPCAVVGSYVHTFARAIEAALKEKNT